MLLELIKEGLKRVCGLEVKMLKELRGLGISARSYIGIGGDGRKYFIKLYERESHEKVSYELEVLRYLRSNGFEVVCDIGYGVLMLNEKPLVVFEYVKGEYPQEIDKEIIREVGKFLGRLHRVEVELLSKGLQEGIKGEGVENTFYKMNEEVFERWGGMEGGLDVERILRHKFRILEEKDALGKRVFLHGDLFPDNTYFVGNKLSKVLDFGGYAYGPIYFDIGVVVLSWCMDSKGIRDDLYMELIFSYNKSASNRIKYGDIVLWEWIKLSALYFGLRRYIIYKSKGEKSLKGRRYEEYIMKYKQLEAVF